MTAAHATDQADMLRQLAGNAKRCNHPEETAQPRQGSRVISVTSGKGGVGKSSIVINLAQSLAVLGKRVLVVDADSERGDLFLLLGKKPACTMNQVITGEKSLKESLVEVEIGISILPARMVLQQYQSLTPSERLSLLRRMASLQERFDYVLIDTGSGVSANVTGFASAAREVLLVVTPEPSSITDAYALVKTLSGRDASLRYRLLVNRCRDAEEGASVCARLSAITGRFLEISMDYSGCILLDEMLVESVRRRGALCRLYPDARASLSFRALAEKLTTEGSAAVPGMPLDPPAARRKEWRNHELSS